MRRITGRRLGALVAAGVTALECVGGRVSVIRGLTTRTKTGDAADKTFRELTTILIVDDVIPSIRRTLRAKFIPRPSWSS